LILDESITISLTKRVNPIKKSALNSFSDTLHIFFKP
jgi:hypothetical protein